MIEFQKLSDVAELTVGYVGTMGKEYSSQGVLFLRSLNIKPFGFDLRDIKYIPEEFHRKLNKSALHTNDVVIVRTGVPGTCAVIPPELDMCNCADLVIIRPNQEVIDPYFLCAFINSWGRAQVSNVKVGAIQKHFNVTSAEEMLIPVIDIKAQRAISDLLHNINNLIDNNNAICADLEAMAKLLYDYWFVQFDFPDENGKPYKSSGGKMVWNEDLKREIPEGWEANPINHLCSIISGYSFNSETYVENGRYHVLTIKNIQDGYIVSSTDSHVSIIPSDIPKCDILNIGDILMSLTGNVGRVGILCGDNYLLNQRASLIQPKDEEIKWFLYSLFRDESILIQIQRVATGTSQKNVSPTDIGNNVVPYSKKIVKTYSKVICNLIQKLIACNIENQQLASLRDFLLPMLMNGQVKVGGKGDLPPVAYPTDEIRDEYMVAAEPQKAYDTSM